MDLADRLREKSKKMDRKKLDAIRDGDTHMAEALENLSKISEIEKDYNGEEEICNFLAYMNDMVRLASALNEPFPFKEYAGVRDFPRIEVEFFHLKDKTESQAGKFMLLDTPGFNEAGQQKHLLPMMHS